ncbi:hypothetical protein [Paenibacillus nasutitermitis]|uniref:Uncharacterized protein n=1 Tax=Paenibacillus nasutitermitis TaxID=1652958 RepID=A0A917DXK2_9BACL|nr:hypothetical protein [Paenibacillus nasutitermitis]GGD79751.1 hypothetical protein GCM10010911_42290 [Paenibacillus nasutitermitis]
MKTFLISTQILYLLCTVPWLLIWGVSFMGFDQGISFFNVALVILIGVYPLVVVVCSIIAWVLRKRRQRMSVIVNLVPMLWVLGIGLPVLLLQF